MAGELKSQISLTYQKDGVKKVITPADSLVAVDIADPIAIDNIQVIGTAGENLLVGDVVNIAFIYVKNLDQTNYVEVYTSGAYAGYKNRLLPGEDMLVRRPKFPADALVPFGAQANTANCKVRVVIGSL